ncbi:antibiotic biosynthesis monooxygenase family protein [Bradyrhizobium japonicum]
MIFEVLPHKGKCDNYLDNANILRPELEQVEGFVDNIRYKSLTREGWILSLSNWRDEKSLVRWRIRMRHHEVQQKGRDEILADYHLRVGQITADNKVPAGYALTEQRLDETEIGEGMTVTLINATRPAEWKQTNNPYDCAEWLGLSPWAADFTSWDIFEAVLTPGDLILLMSWKDAAAAQAYEDASAPNDKARVRRVRIVRDYGNTTVAKHLNTSKMPRAARPSMPDAAPSGRAMLPRVRLWVRNAARSRVLRGLARNRRLAVDELSLRLAPLAVARLISALTNMSWGRVHAGPPPVRFSATSHALSRLSETPESVSVRPNQ